jgi:hypothetical protein
MYDCEIESEVSLYINEVIMKRILILFSILALTILPSQAVFTDADLKMRYTKAAIAGFIFPVAVGVNAFHRFKGVHPQGSTKEAVFLSTLVGGFATKPWLDLMQFALSRRTIATAIANNQRTKPLLALSTTCTTVGILWQALSDQIDKILYGNA